MIEAISNKFIMESNIIFSELAPIVSKISRKVDNELTGILDSAGISYELISTGSTSRNTYINNGINSNYNPIDLDYKLVVKDKLDESELKKIQKKLNLQYGFKETCNNQILNYMRNGLHISLGIVEDNFVNQNHPIIYSKNCEQFTKDELEQIRGFKLFSQRFGIYGGFNKAIKGILIEQLILKYGSFKDSFNALTQGFENSVDLDVKHYEGKDLVSRISQGNRRRIITLNNLSNKNMDLSQQIPDVHVWNMLNQGRQNLRFEIVNNDVGNVRLKLNDSLNQVLDTTKVNYDVYCVESLDSKHLAFATLEDISEMRIIELKKNLLKYNNKKIKQMYK